MHCDVKKHEIPLFPIPKNQELIEQIKESTLLHEEEIKSQIRLSQNRILQCINNNLATLDVLKQINRVQDVIDSLYRHEKITSLQKELNILHEKVCEKINHNPHAQEIKEKIRQIRKLKQEIRTTAEPERKQLTQLYREFQLTNTASGTYATETVFDDNKESDIERKIASISDAIKEKTTAYHEEIETLRNDIIELIGQDDSKINTLSRLLDYKHHKISERMNMLSKRMDNLFEQLDHKLTHQERCKIECIQKHIRHLQNELLLHHPCTYRTLQAPPHLFEIHYLLEDAL